MEFAKKNLKFAVNVPFLPIPLTDIPLPVSQKGLYHFLCTLFLSLRSGTSSPLTCGVPRTSKEITFWHWPTVVLNSWSLTLVGCEAMALLDRCVYCINRCDLPVEGGSGWGSGGELNPWHWSMMCGMLIVCVAT